MTTISSVIRRKKTAKFPVPPLAGMAPFGKERTAKECRLRAQWERKMAKAVLAMPFGEFVAPGHEQAARAYDQLAASKS